MPTRKPAGAFARPAARMRASASAKSIAPRKKSASPKSAPRKKPTLTKRKPRTNPAHHRPVRPRRKVRRSPDAAPPRKAASRKPALRPIRQPPPPRAADPLARQTGARRAYYTPEFQAEAKRRVEQTTQSTNAIAHDFGMDHGPLWRLIERYGWVRPEGALRRPRGLSPVMRLEMQAEALAAAHPNPLPGERASTPVFDGLCGEREQTEPAALASPDSEPVVPVSLDNATIARLEAAVLKELATVETMRASLANEPQRPADAAHTARTLASLTDTLSKLRRLRLAAQPQQDNNAHDDMPADIDEFRNELARRIRALVASRTGGGGADGN